jgi:hypothetical protein
MIGIQIGQNVEHVPQMVHCCIQIDFIGKRLDRPVYRYCERALNGGLDNVLSGAGISFGLRVPIWGPSTQGQRHDMIIRSKSSEVICRGIN